MRFLIFFLFLFFSFWTTYKLMQIVSVLIIGRRFRFSRSRLQSINDIWDPLMSGIVMLLSGFLAGTLFALCVKYNLFGWT